MRAFRLFALCLLGSVSCSPDAPEGARGGANEGVVRPQGAIRTKAVSVERDPSPARRAALLGAPVWEDFESKAVLILENGEVARQIDATNGSVYIDPSTGCFTINRMRWREGENTIDVYDPAGEHLFRVHPQRPDETFVGLLEGAVATRPFPLHKELTDYHISFYDSHGHVKTIAHADRVLEATDSIGGHTLLTRSGRENGYTITLYGGKGNVRWEYLVPKDRMVLHAASPKGRYLLVAHRRHDIHPAETTYVLHSDEHGAVEWQWQFPRSIIFLEERATLISASISGESLAAFDFNGKMRWSIGTSPFMIRSVAVHELNGVPVISCYGLQRMPDRQVEGQATAYVPPQPRIAHYRLDDGSKIGETDLHEHFEEAQIDPERDLMRWPFYARGGGVLSLPFRTAVLTVELERVER